MFPESRDFSGKAFLSDENRCGPGANRVWKLLPGLNRPVLTFLRMNPREIQKPESLPCFFQTFGLFLAQDFVDESFAKAKFLGLGNAAFVGEKGSIRNNLNTIWIQAEFRIGRF